MSPGANVSASLPRTPADGAEVHATTAAPQAAASKATSPKVSSSPGITTHDARA